MRWETAKQDDGFTIVEVLVAIVILAAGALAVLGIFDTATRNTFRAEQSQVANNVVQRELEKIRQYDYKKIALNPAPVRPPGDPTDTWLTTSSTSSGSPIYRYNRTAQTFAVGWNGSIPTNYGDLDVKTDGSVDPGPTTFHSGDVSGKIYRFVVWQNDANCLADPTGNINLCPGLHDYKRVIVIVTLDTVAASYARPYLEIQSNFTDPDATAVTAGTSPPGTPDVIGEQFFLSDTTCDNPTRQDIAHPVDAANGGPGHPTHDTRGNCTVTSTNKPDGLYASAPPDPDENDPNNPPTYDYSTEVEPGDPGLASTDRGLQMLKQTQSGCDFSGGSTSPQYKIHRWVSAPVPGTLATGFQMTGQATLKLFTRTINDVPNIDAGICVFLFKADTTGAPIPLSQFIDVLPSATQNDPRPPGDCGTLGNAYFAYCLSQWPYGKWTEIDLQMNFAPTPILPGQRLGLAVGVGSDFTLSPPPNDVLQFMYDHPDEASRLEVKTTTPLP